MLSRDNNSKDILLDWIADDFETVSVYFFSAGVRGKNFLFTLCSTMADVEDLTNLAKPTSDATLTVRCIKNFEYRTCKNLVLQHVNLETSTVGDLKKLVLESKRSHMFY